MTPTRLLLIGLLLLTGCSSEAPRPYVSVTINENRPCNPPSHAWTQGTGQLLRCDAQGCTFYCDGKDTYNEPKTIILSPEEFTFKYDHDKAFHDSIQSYTFQ